METFHLRCDFNHCQKRALLTPLRDENWVRLLKVYRIHTLVIHDLKDFFFSLHPSISLQPNGEGGGYIGKRVTYIYFLCHVNSDQI